MNLIVDGQYVRGTCRTSRSARCRSQYVARIRGWRRSLTIDEIVDGRSIMGIEIYPSIGTRPPS